MKYNCDLPVITHYTILNVWLLKNDKLAVLLLDSMLPNGVLYLKMEDPY